MMQPTDLRIVDLPYLPGTHNGQDGMFCQLTERAWVFVPGAQHGQALILDVDPAAETLAVPGVPRALAGRRVT